MPSPISGFDVAVPPWLRERVAQLPSRYDDLDDLMTALNELAARNVAEGTGGPFAAAVVDTPTGDLIAVGVNLVLASGLSCAHAEVVTLSLAQRSVGDWNLGTGGSHRTLVVNAQPCAMCTGAIAWSGVSAVEYAASGSAVEALTGFDEGPVAENWRSELERRGIRVSAGRGEQQALAVLEAYRRAVAAGAIALYNGGGRGT